MDTFPPSDTREPLASPWRRAWPWLVVALGLAAVFGPAIASGALLAPGESIALAFPLRVIASESLRLGEWPFWNPFEFGGMPLMAALQGGVLFPCNWFFALLPAVAAMNAAVVATYAVAAGGMLGLARALGLGRLGACVAALAFAFSGFMLAHMEHLAMIQAAAMLPWVLWTIERHRRTMAARDGAAMGLAVALQILAGHPTMVVFSLGVALPYALLRARGLERRGRYLGMLLAAGLLGVGLAGVQLAPSLDLIGESQRQAFPYELLVAESLPPRQLLSLWFPFLFGAPPSAWFPTPYWGAGPWFNEVVGYVGLSTLVLGAGAIALWRREPRTRYWAIVALVGLLLALGGATPLYKLWAQLPVLKALRAPGRHLMEVDFALALLAGFGAQALLEGRLSRRRMLLAWAIVGLPVGAVLAGVAVAGPAIAARLQPFMPAGVEMSSALSLRQPALWLPAVLWVLAGLAFVRLHGRRRALAAAIGLLVAADLAVFAVHQGWKQLSPVVPADFPASLGRPSETSRTLSIGAQPFPYYDFAEVQRLRAAGYAALGHERTVNGYDAFIKVRYSGLVGGMTHGGVLTRTDVWQDGHHAFDVLGLGRLRLDAGLWQQPAWRARLAPPRWCRLADEAGMAFFENTRALPRAWRVARVSALEAAEVDRRVTRDVGFDPRTEALVEEAIAPGARTGGPAGIRPVSHNRLQLTTSGAGPGLVVVNESYDAGWTAWEGGRSLPVRRVDGLVLGIELPPGAHEVALVYEPVHWRLGLGVSLASALALLGLLAWRRPGGARA